MKTWLPEALFKEDLIRAFDKINSELKYKGKNLNITIIGGAAEVLKDYIERSTTDIDVLKGSENFKLFEEECKKVNIPVQIVSVVTTIDSNCEKEKVYSGDFLTIYSVSPKNLIKSKLERFQFQDPEDIYKIIEKEKISYNEFEKLFKEMLSYFVGNKNRLIMSARTVVENIFPYNIQEFYNSFPI